MTMTGKQKWVLGLRSLASPLFALDALVISTVLSTIRLHDLSETRAINPDRIGRGSASTR
jgi:hypothetical protein